MAKKANWNEMHECVHEEKGFTLLKEQSGGLNNG
jgi:hypothetical protein